MPGCGLHILQARAIVEYRGDKCSLHGTGGVAFPIGNNCGLKRREPFMLWQSDSHDGIYVPSLCGFFAALIQCGNDDFIN